MQITKTQKILVSGVLGGLLLLSMEGCSNFRVPGFTNNETCYEDGSYSNNTEAEEYYYNPGYSNYMAVEHPYWTPYDTYAGYNNRNYQPGYATNEQYPQQWQHSQNMQYAPAENSWQPQPNVAYGQHYEQQYGQMQQQYPAEGNYNPNVNTGQYYAPTQPTAQYYSYAPPVKEGKNHFWFDRLGNKKQRN